MEKTCSKCGGAFPLTAEFWCKRKDSKDGFGWWCKECGRADAREYYKKNAEKKKEYYKENAEKKAEYGKEYHKKNAEKINTRKRKDYKKDNRKAKKYYRKNVGKILKQTKEYRKKNTKKLAKYRKGYNKKHAGKVTDQYIKTVLKMCGYTPDQITPESIKERRNQILFKRLRVPIGTDTTQEITADTPAWV